MREETKAEATVKATYTEMCDNELEYYRHLICVGVEFEDGEYPDSLWWYHEEKTR